MTETDKTVVENPDHAGFVQLAIPVLVVFREPGMHQMSPSVKSLAHIVARVIRDSFNVKYGKVVVLAGDPVHPLTLSDSYVSFALQVGKVPELSKEESSIDKVATFICENFDAELVYETLGGMLQKQKDQIGK